MFKTIPLLLAILSLNTVASTDYETKEFLLSNKTISSTIALNQSTVRCSMIGYGTEELKISVPDLEWAAFFDHSNIGESQPCMSAGLCSFIGFPRQQVHPDILSILDNNKPTETVDIEIILKEVYSLNHKNKSCTRQITEDLSSTVRSKLFTHRRSKSLGSYPYDLCLQVLSQI